MTRSSRMAAVLVAAIAGHLGAAGAQTQFAVSAGSEITHGTAGMLRQLVLVTEMNGQQEGGPFVLHYRLRPGLVLGDMPRFDPGVQDAYLSYTTQDLRLTAGWERLPLEMARLSVPYGLDAVSEQGDRLGRPGARVTYTTDQVRYRVALLFDGETAVPVVSVRKAFPTADTEMHALWRGGRGVVGAGSSATVGEIVIFGEAWLLTNPLDYRGVLGASGTLGQNMWTVEGGYTQVSPSAPPQFTLASQFAVPQGENRSWTLHGVITRTAGHWQAMPSLSYTHRQGNADLNLTVGGTFGTQSAIFAKASVKLFAP